MLPRHLAQIAQPLHIAGQGDLFAVHPVKRINVRRQHLGGYRRHELLQMLTVGHRRHMFPVPRLPLFIGENPFRISGKLVRGAVVGQQIRQGDMLRQVFLKCPGELFALREHGGMRLVEQRTAEIVRHIRKPVGKLRHPLPVVRRRLGRIRPEPVKIPLEQDHLNAVFRAPTQQVIPLFPVFPRHEHRVHAGVCHQADILLTIDRPRGNIAADTQLPGAFILVSHFLIPHFIPFVIFDAPRRRAAVQYGRHALRAVHAPAPAYIRSGSRPARA